MSQPNGHVAPRRRVKAQPAVLERAPRVEAVGSDQGVVGNDRSTDRRGPAFGCGARRRSRPCCLRIGATARPRC